MRVREPPGLPRLPNLLCLPLEQDLQSELDLAGGCLRLIDNARSRRRHAVLVEDGVVSRGAAKLLLLNMLNASARNCTLPPSTSGEF